MKKILVLLTICITLIFMLMLLFNNKTSYLVYIENDNDNSIVSGSGIVYKYENNKYYILTNYHIVYGYNSLSISNNKGKKVQGKLIYYDEDKDIALITVENIKLDVIDTYICDYKKTDKVTINGLYNKKKIIKKGYILKEKENITIQNEFGISKYDSIKINSNIEPGDSGSAVFDSNGNLIGMMSVMNKTNSESFAIPICDIIDILN